MTLLCIVLGGLCVALTVALVASENRARFWQSHAAALESVGDDLVKSIVELSSHITGMANELAERDAADDSESLELPDGWRRDRAHPRILDDLDEDDDWRNDPGGLYPAPEDMM